MPEPFSENRIEVITGCMFAGKTEELFRRLRRAEIAGKSIKVFTPDVDCRTGESLIGSHNGESLSATVLDSEGPYSELVNYSQDFDLMAIDEGNFFTSALIPVLDSVSNNDTRVIVTGLDQNFRGEPFEPMNDVMAIADSVKKLSAICSQCGKQATRTQRLIDGEPAPAESPTILVGGEESYEARCRECHQVI